MNITVPFSLCVGNCIVKTIIDSAACISIITKEKYGDIDFDYKTIQKKYQGNFTLRPNLTFRKWNQGKIKIEIGGQYQWVPVLVLKEIIVDNVDLVMSYSYSNLIEWTCNNSNVSE